MVSLSSETIMFAQGFFHSIIFINYFTGRFSRKASRCRRFGNLWEKNNLVANTACCACKNCGDLETLGENIFQEHGGH